MKKILCTYLLFILCLQAYSQEKLLWDFRIGAGKEFYKDSEDIEEKFNVNVYNAELGLDIAIGDKFAIQPSFMYKLMHDKDGEFYFYDDPYYYDWEEKRFQHFFEVPVLFNYKLPLSKNQKIRFSAGPYVCTNVDFNDYEVGANLRVTYEYKKLNVGISSELPIFNNPFPRDYGKKQPGICLNIGIKFRSKTWKSIGMVAGAVGVVAGTVGMAVMESKASNSDSSSSYETSGDGSSSGSSKGSKDSKVSDRNAKWMQGNYSRSKKTYSDYESQLIKMNTYPDQYNRTGRIDIQSKMRQVRKTITDHGGTCSKSQWEDWNPER